MSACKVAPFVHFEHFIFLLYSLVPGGVASCSARSVIAYSGGIIGLFALLVHLPTHLLVYIIAVYSVVGQAGTGSPLLPSLIISCWLPCVHFILLAPDTQPAIPRSGSRGFPAFNQRQIKKTFLRTFRVLTRVHCNILKVVGHDMLLNSVFKYIIKTAIHVVQRSSGQNPDLWFWHFYPELVDTCYDYV